MPQIPAGWKETTLGNLIYSGEIQIKNFLRKPISSNERSKIQWEYPYYWAASAIDSLNSFSLEGLHLLIAEDWTVVTNKNSPMLQLVDGKFNVSNHAHILQGNDNQETRFLYYLLSNVNVLPYITWAVQPKLSKENLLKICFLIPESLPEQQAIAAVLSSFDDKIELLRAENQTLEQMGQELFKERFGKWKIGDELPEGWRVGKLEEMVDLLNGFSYKSSDFVENGKYRLVTIANVQDWNFIEKTKDSLDSIPEKMPDHCLLKTGDILLSLTWNVGRVCLVIGEYYFLNQRVAKISPKNPIDYAYSYLYFRQKHMITLLESISVGTAQQNLSPIKTSGLSIIVPLREILDSFSEKANILVRKIIKNLEQIQTLSSTRDQLLPKLMSWEVRVKF